MKAGADDFLVAHGVQALQELLENPFPFNPALSDEEVEVAWQTKDLTPQTLLSEKLKRLAVLTPTLARMSNMEAAAILEELRARLKLRGEDLASLKADVKKALKEREAKSKRGQGKAQEIGDLQEGLRLHSAIDFLGEAMVIGFRVSLADNAPGLLLVLSDGQGVRAVVNPETVEIGERVYQVMQNTAPPFLQDVWNLDRLKAFLKHPTRPKGLYKVLVEAFKKYLDLPEPSYGLLAAWVVGTYFAHLFSAFPYLHFRGPKESGKSKTEEALKNVSFNAWKGRDITPAALADTMDGQRGTVLIDQAEKLSSDKENGNLIGLLADSYKKAGGKRRVVEVTKAGRSVLEFSAYGPKAFASTKNLDPDLADRCVRVAMIKTRKKLPDLEGWEPIWRELRDNIYRFILTNFKDVQSHYQAIAGDGTRIGELWRPILAVLRALEVEESEIEAIRALFMEGAEEGRHELKPWESTLFEVLKEKAESGAETFEMIPEDILMALDIQGESKPGFTWVGNTLSNFSLYSKRLPRKYAEGNRNKKVQPYLFNSAQVLKLYEIYMRDTQNEVSQASQAEKSNESDSFSGTEEESGTCPEASQEEEMGDLGRNWTCPDKTKCPTENNEITNYSDLGQAGRSKPGGPPEENINLFSGEEVEL